jgi:pimeloyl-ACP methyl ester carboxylesterase
MLKPPTYFRLLAPVGEQPGKPLFVYLPGMDGTGDLLVTQIPTLQPYFDIRCLAIPGDDLTPWEGMASQVIQLIQLVAGDRPIYLCGESFGACLALQVVGQAPQLADYLILINSASSFHRLSLLHWVAQLTPWVMPPLYQTSTLTSLPVLANLSRIQFPERERLLQAVRSVSQSSTAWRLSLLAQFRLEPLPLQEVRAQTLLVASLADRLLPSIAEAQILATLLPQTCIYPLPDSGHVSLLEQDVNLGRILAAVDFLPSPATPPSPLTHARGRGELEHVN